MQPLFKTEAASSRLLLYQRHPGARRGTSSTCGGRGGQAYKMVHLRCLLSLVSPSRHVIVQSLKRVLQYAQHASAAACIRLPGWLQSPKNTPPGCGPQCGSNSSVASQYMAHPLLAIDPTFATEHSLQQSQEAQSVNATHPHVSLISKHLSLLLLLLLLWSQCYRYLHRCRCCLLLLICHLLLLLLLHCSSS